MAEKAKDVVCEVMVDPDTAAAKTTYAGKIHDFCAPGSKLAFERNPEQYLECGGNSGDHHGHRR